MRFDSRILFGTMGLLLPSFALFRRRCNCQCASRKNTLKLTHHLRYCLQDLLSLLPIAKIPVIPHTFSLSFGYTSKTSRIAPCVAIQKSRTDQFVHGRDGTYGLQRICHAAFEKLPSLLFTAPEEFGAGSRSALPRPTPL